MMGQTAVSRVTWTVQKITQAGRSSPWRSRSQYLEQTVILTTGEAAQERVIISQKRGSSGEQVWTSLQYWSPDVTSRGFLYSEVPCGHCMVRSNASRVIVTWDPLWREWQTDRQTDTTENITFPQLRWRAVKIHGWKWLNKMYQRTPRRREIGNVRSYQAVTIVF